jgi:ADP-heptose:LPS heptosyltransferase
MDDIFMTAIASTLPVDLDEANAGDGDPGVLQRLLDEFDARDFRQVERIVEVFKRQGRTVAGYPRVRPSDCRRVIIALHSAMNAHLTYFRYGDRRIVGRFWAIADALHGWPVTEYPNELLHLNIVRANAHVVSGNAAEAHALLAHFEERPYLIEGDASALLGVCLLAAQARAASGAVEMSGRQISNLLLLVRLRPWLAASFFSQFTPFIAMPPTLAWKEGRLAALVQRTARYAMSLRRERGNKVWNIFLGSIRRLTDVAGGFGALVLAFGGARPAIVDAAAEAPPAESGRPQTVKRRAPFVTRAMGGIGDILMMSPGLRALSLKHGHPVKFAIKRQFHPLFENNPYVEIVDIDGPPVDLLRYRWFNLSSCPAAMHESLRRPFVKKGRVELFARGMGVRRRRLMQSGQKIDIMLSPEQRAFGDRWIAERKLGATRPIVGVQPHSREAYRDHPHMYQIIAALARRYDVLVFHHLPLELGAAINVASTAGLKLGESLALVAKLQAMVCVDSAFLHAAGAFDVPTVTLFGPIDGPLRTVHMQEAAVIDARDVFSCSPCWRNEDQPCLVTGHPGNSPCMAAITIARVLDAVARKVSLGAVVEHAGTI